MNALRAVIGMAGIALLGLIVWAMFAYTDLHGDLIQQFGVIASLPWGVVSLVDLYVGFLLFAALVFIVERSWWAAILWALPVFVLGNIWAALWFVLRLPLLIEKLARAPDPPRS
ncbi:MAG: hypothetical protein AB7J28_12075 [Hyphomonadaceae bacterium]